MLPSCKKLLGQAPFLSLFIWIIDHNHISYFKTSLIKSLLEILVLVLNVAPRGGVVNMHPNLFSAEQFYC